MMYGPFDKMVIVSKINGQPSYMEESDLEYGEREMLLL